jgi:hypothetical protein
MSFVERESARKPIWPNTSPSPRLADQAVEAEAGADRQLAAGDPAVELAEGR